jgi:mannitol-1-phosphate 5-dehydrogenase
MLNRGLATGKTFVGFGFGAIQAGLFLWEAQQSGNFKRLVVAMANDEVIEALRRNQGKFFINVATSSRREVCEVRGVEIYNSRVAVDREALLEAVAEADELATALPSVETYEQTNASTADILVAGLRLKIRQRGPPCILYAAENHNHAAEVLETLVHRQLAPEEAAQLGLYFQPLNTVIGKMSRVIRDQSEIAESGLQPFVDGGSRAYLVEQFNHILISQVFLPEFRRGIEVFEEKPDLLPFEEAKLYGHNAAHALLGYLGRQRSLRFVAEAAKDAGLMSFVRDAFLEESGRALIARRAGVDQLFTPEGYRAYADDLLERMVNPWLRDDIERVTRDPRRKLGWNDRLVGTMRLALGENVEPFRFALGAAAALQQLQCDERDKTEAEILQNLWSGASASEDDQLRISNLMIVAKNREKNSLACESAHDVLASKPSI